MRATTRSEKFLLGVLALVALGGGLFFGGSALLQKQRALELSRASLRADQAEAEVDLQQQALWEKRRAWIKDHEPPAGEEGDLGAQLQGFAVQGARDHHLEILEQNLNEAQHGPGGLRVNVELKVKGGMEGLCRWLADLQDPANFYAVGLFSLKADQDEKSMVCTVQIGRYFRESSP